MQERRVEWQDALENLEMMRLSNIQYTSETLEPSTNHNLCYTVGPDMPFELLWRPRRIRPRVYTRAPYNTLRQNKN